MTTTWLLLLLIVDPLGHQTKQTIPFSAKEDCYAAIVTYIEALDAAKWNVKVHGSPMVMCQYTVDI